jgi:hypothetical protein
MPADACYISTVKVRAGVCHGSVAKGNCVGPKRRGKQPVANCRSVGGRTRFGGELRRACSFMAKSKAAGHAEVAVKAMSKQPTWLEAERQEGEVEQAGRPAR